VRASPGTGPVTAKITGARCEKCRACETGHPFCLRKHLITNTSGPVFLTMSVNIRAVNHGKSVSGISRNWTALKDHDRPASSCRKRGGDSQRLVGAHKFAPRNRLAFRRSLTWDRANQCDCLRSSGFFEKRDLISGMRGTRSRSVELFYQYARVRLRVPGWRAYTMERQARQDYDEYGIDGIFTTWHVRWAVIRASTRDEGMAFDRRNRAMALWRSASSYL